MAAKKAVAFSLAVGIVAGICSIALLGSIEWSFALSHPVMGPPAGVDTSIDTRPIVTPPLWQQNAGFLLLPLAFVACVAISARVARVETMNGRLAAHAFWAYSAFCALVFSVIDLLNPKLDVLPFNDFLLVVATANQLMLAFTVACAITLAAFALRERRAKVVGKNSSIETIFSIVCLLVVSCTINMVTSGHP